MDNQEIVLEGIKRDIILDGKIFVNPDFIETNSSIIIFVGDLAFKILKKGREEIDCSTASARRSLLEEEMQSNSEINANLYFGIRPVFMVGKQIIFRENGWSDNDNRAVDYVLCMRRLRPESLVRNMLLSATYRDEASVLIAKTIASFHFSKLSDGLTNDDRDLIRKFGTIGCLMGIVEKDFQIFEGLSNTLIPTAITRQKYQEIKKYIVRFLESEMGMLIERIRSGRVLPIHGDFHSRNIFIENGIVYAVDRSLRKNMRVGDIIKDVAYFLVDLEMFGRDKSKRIFLDVYHSVISDECFAQLLPFYMCRRAFVAGIVNFSEENIEHLKAYFDFAYNYAVNNQL